MPNHDEDSPGPRLTYRHGLAVLRHVREAPEEMAWDDRVEGWVAPGHRLPEVRRWAEERGLELDAPEAERLDGRFFDPRTPRDYQRRALDRWTAEDAQGSIVLPTGSGKTFVAILAVERHGRGACVVAPTRALVSQWYAQLADAFGADRVGTFYTDEKDVRPITVTTYHSAFTVQERWGDRFDLLVLDEVHHLADDPGGEARNRHDAVRIAPARRRLGLTATYPDGRDSEFRRLVGPVAYRKRVGEMADAELAAFALERRFVSLTAEERERYEEATDAYECFVEEKGYRDRYDDPGDAWRVFMAETRTSPAARRAHRAFRERERIVSLAENKLREAGRLLRLYPAERAVLFCGSRAAAERVSRLFAVPMIEAETPASERKRVLDDLDEERIRAVASVRVLDEGWDVPGAKLGIVLGDTTRGGRRQQVQRLGRLLRKQGDRVASMYELVAADTHEFFASQKRGAGLRSGPDRQLGLGI